MDAAQGLSGHCGREGLSWKQVERCWWLEMYDDVKNWVKICKQCQMRAPLQYDKPLKSPTVTHLWQQVRMDILYMPKTENRYHLHVVAREYCSAWAGAWPLKQGTSEKVAGFLHEEVIGWFGPPDSVVVDGHAEKMKWTDLFLKHYNILMITVTAYHAASNGVIKWGHRLIADAQSKLTACSNKLEEMSMEHPAEVALADRITISRSSRCSPSHLMVGQDTVLPIELENCTCNTANCIQGIDDTASVIAATATRLERRWEDIDTAIQNIKESRDSNKAYVDQAANLRTEDPRIGDLALVHET